jgi:hypothetical protein
MSKKLRGSYYVDGRRSMTLPTADNDKLVDVGFRLVSDVADRVGRGGGWLFVRQSARVAFRLNYDPAYRYGNLGFRLMRDGT